MEIWISEGICISVEQIKELMCEIYIKKNSNYKDSDSTMLKIFKEQEFQRDNFCLNGYITLKEIIFKVKHHHQ